MMEKFFSFMSFHEQHQQGAPAQSNNSNNNNATPMSLDGSSYARGNQQQPTFASYEPQRGSQDMDLQEERHKKKASVPEFAFHTQRHYNNNNYRHQPKPVPPFCHLCKTPSHPPRLAASYFNQIRRMQPSLKASRPGKTRGS
ncbi:unnamed protein product [Closterium sp. NIES-54]